MANNFPSLSSWVNTVQNNSRKANFRAINKAQAKTNTLMKRSISKDLGVKSSVISKRFKQKKASMKSLYAEVGVGTRYNLSLEFFKPKVKIIKKNKRKYIGVTANIPNSGTAKREIVQSAFLLNTKSGKALVMKRKGSERKPLEKVTFNIFSIANSKKKDFEKFYAEDFKQQLKAQIKYITDKNF